MNVTIKGVVRGPFRSIVEQSDGLQCDELFLPFSVYGTEYVISEDDSLIPPPPAPSVPVPESVSRCQALQALYLQRGITEDQVLALINAIPDADQRYLASVEFRTSQIFERARPLVQSIGAALGLTSEEIDTLFVFANTL